MPEDPKQKILDTPITAEEVRGALDGFLKTGEQAQLEIPEVLRNAFTGLIGLCEQERMLTIGRVFEILSEAKGKKPETRERKEYYSTVVLEIITLLARSKGLEKELQDSGLIKSLGLDDNEPESPGRG